MRCRKETKALDRGMLGFILFFKREIERREGCVRREEYVLSQKVVANLNPPKPLNSQMFSKTLGIALGVFAFYASGIMHGESVVWLAMAAQ